MRFTSAHHRLIRRAASCERGVTLIELLVAMAILTVVVSGAVMLFTAVVNVQSEQTDRSAKVGETRVSLNRMIREIRQGLSVESGTGSQLVMRTYVRTTCAGAVSATSTLCRVTWTCQTTTCTRRLANPDGTGTGAAITQVRGISNPTTVFSYTGSPATYVGVKLVVPADDGRSSLTLQDGASLRNATLNV